MMTLFRAADFGSPLRVEPSRSPGRFHRAGATSPTQYLCDHPLGPLAEKLRAQGLRTVEEVRELQWRTWALRVDVDGLVEISFEEANAHGILPSELVSDSLSPCQDLADRKRAEGVRGLIVPSAALPGTRCVVMFGERVASGYLDDPIDSHLDIPASMTSDPGHSPDSLLALVRFKGDQHVGLKAWEGGGGYRFEEPDWSI